MAKFILCPGKGTLKEELQDVLLGCDLTLRRLGKLKETLESFTISFTSFNQDSVEGPVIRTVFLDPLGTECSHTTDYRFMGTKRPDLFTLQGLT